MSLTNEQIIEAIASKSVTEIVELIAAMEEKFGVSAAAAVAAAPAAGGAAAAEEKTEFECLAETFTGPTLIAFSNEHPGAAARLFTEFAKTNKEFEIKGAAFEGKTQDVQFLATLPTYEEAIARLMGTMKEAAAGKLARTLAALRDKLEAEAA